MRHAGTSVTEYKCDTFIVPSPIKLTTTPLYAVTTILLAKHLTELIKVSIFSARAGQEKWGNEQSAAGNPMRLRRDFFAVTRRNAIFCAPFAALERRLLTAELTLCSARRRASRALLFSPPCADLLESLADARAREQVAR